MGGKSGVVIDRCQYDDLKNFVLETLETHTSATLSMLLEKGEQRFKHIFKEDTGWYLYNVKLDLEAKGLITQETAQKKTKHSALIRKTESGEFAAAKISENKSAELTRSLHEKFVELFGRQPIIVHAPGRINLIGEHTDYNGGFALPVSIDKGIQVAVSRSSMETIIYSVRYKQYLSVDLENVQPLKSPGWSNYLLGVIQRLLALGYKLKPFKCVLDADLPAGAGISSSAALECGFAMALNELFTLGLSKLQLIEIAQWAEHNFVGVKCGIMDQFASVMGKENHAILLDSRTLEFQYYPLQLGEYCIVLCDSNVKHSLASSEYNVRRSECESALATIQQNGFGAVNDLTEVTTDMLESVKGILSPAIHNRCKYILDENIRVFRATEALKTGNVEALGNLLFESHRGLSQLYEVSCAELDFLVAIAREFQGVVGSRMMGGGFGGCTVNLVHTSSVGDFITSAKSQYKKMFNKELTCHLVKTGNGAHVINNPNS
jgi:galactokinase